MRSRGWGVKVGVVVVVLALVAAAAGVFVWWRDREGAAVREAARSVAEGLSRGGFGDSGAMRDSSGGPPDLEPILRGMGEATHEVTVRSVTDPDGGSARATLAHTWTLPGTDEAWTYETPLELAKADGEWAGVWSPAVVAPDLAEGEALRTTRKQPERAEVLGAGGRPIVELRDVVRIGIDKTKATPAEAVSSARVLAQAVGVNVENFVASVQKAGEQAFVEAITARVGSSQEQAAREVDAPGTFLVSARIPLAPTSTFARPILGVVGDATAEIVEKSDGRIAAGDRVGIGGVQGAYDTQLAGTPGYSVVTSGGAESRTLFSTEPEAGSPVTLTLDIATQAAAETVLEKVEPASAVVAIQPSTGRVLAAASGPGSKGISTATQGRYAPGSTFKTVSTLALLRSGVTPSTTVQCPPTTTVDGRTFKNVDGFPISALGAVPFATAFANSCNTAFIGLGEKLEPADLPTAGAGLGLTGEPALGIPAFLGSVPEPKPGTDAAASMIGQSKVLASPLGMATVAASIAAGRPVAPVLVEAGEGVKGGVSPSASPSAAATTAPKAPAEPVTAAEAGQLRSLMRGVVESGSGTFLRDVPGAPVLAKSGTAEFGEAGALKEHAWMIGIQGDLAVAVLVVEGEGGATTAGPLLEAFLRAVG
ncbi:penicillin-binding transpeptidase domain-containing protein [Knoellia sp. CPCC 206450]|uniref:penicillin-binding transpeptidase domain-containing protein n=1 Tax=Knoellia tibetensis TaxID=3404798 RepID=UPI003B42E956